MESTLKVARVNCCFGKEDILLDGKLEGGSEMIVLLVSFEKPICAVDCEWWLELLEAKTVWGGLTDVGIISSELITLGEAADTLVLTWV